MLKLMNKLTKVSKERNKVSLRQLINVWLKFMPRKQVKQTKLPKISKKPRLLEDRLIKLL